MTAPLRKPITAKRAWPTPPIAMPNNSVVSPTCAHCKKQFTTPDRSRRYCLEPECQRAKVAEQKARDKAVMAKRQAKAKRLEKLKELGLA